MNIKHLKHYQIDKAKWDAAIEKADNGLVYALSWYLDIVSPGWGALILGNYEMVMPLTLKRKLGIKYFYKPVFVQFLGVFGNAIKEELIEQFIYESLSNVKYIDIWFNPLNPLKENSFYTKRQTQYLGLSKSYADIYKNYSRSNKQNLQKANKENFTISNEKKPDDLITALKIMYSKKGVKGVKESDYTNLLKIIDYAYHKSIGTFYDARMNDKICSIAFFIKWKGQYTIYFATTDLGREKRSIFLLIDQFIKDHAGQEAVLDFAGSNIPGVSYMNKGFGADEYNYYSVKINKLPTLLKWIKR